MAIIRRQNQDLLNQDQGQPGQDTVVATSTQSSQTPQSQPGQGAPAGGQVQKGPSTSGRFTNIQNFIRANKSGQIGQQVSQKVGAEAEKAKGALSQATGEFSAQAGQARGAVEAARSAVPAAIQNLSQNQNADESIKNLSGALQTEYKGPTALGNEAQLASQAQNLQSIGQAGKSEGGRFALLQRFFGRDRPTYSTGQTRLDNLLLGRQSDVLGKIAGEARAFGGQVRSEQEAAAKQARDSQALAKETQALAKSEGSKAFSTLETGLQSEAKKKATDEINRIRDQVARSGILNELGLPNDTSLQEMERLGLVSVPDSIKAMASGQASIPQLSAANQQTASTLGKLSELLQLNKAYDASAPGLESAATTSAFQSLPQQINTFTEQELTNPVLYQVPTIAKKAQDVIDVNAAKLKNSAGFSARKFEQEKAQISSLLADPSIKSWNDYSAKANQMGLRYATAVGPEIINDFISSRNAEARKMAVNRVRESFGLQTGQGVDQAPAANRAPAPVVQGGGLAAPTMTWAE